MNPIRLQLERPRLDGATIEAAASLTHPDGRSLRLWWRLPAQWEHALTNWADPFVVGMLFPMMQWQGPVLVEGKVSPSLLANLETCMQVWKTWFPERYRPVSIRASEEVEPPPAAEPDATVVPFSGGVDSCFTLLRHRRGLVGRRTRDVAAGVLFDGFDIWPGEPHAAAKHAALLANARALLADAGIPCIPMSSNFHDLPTVWADSHGCHLVSGLALLAGQFGGALLPNTIPYYQLGIPWGTHPLTDPLLGSRSFRVLDDGADSNRFNKVRLVADWPEALRRLHVCYCNHHGPGNCCRCEKCIRTILAFRALGLPRPDSFAADVSDRQIRRTHFSHPDNTRYWLEVADAAIEAGLGRASWVRALHAAVAHDRRRRFFAHFKRPFVPVRNLFRVLFRGSSLSRRQRRKSTRSAARHR
ncbi:MAG: hypothetical protein NTV86_12090 [Planctomycetota bacterium]|nr:hypothetical protein [Planctomycetota bacterium]